ncbi:MAG TPA: AMP-binding protein [Chthoniobacteraceae bacterium]|jgi:phenylacetate-CoA ligase|nr:AMP-binding protein [Chthoniobacteraceae bacterium]
MSDLSQLPRLRALLAALARSNRFYAPRLHGAGLGADCASLEEFSARMPFTTKGDLVADQLAHPPYGTNHTSPLAAYTRFCQTSGTTSTPLSILDTPESWDWMLENWRIILEAGGIRPGDRVYFAFSFGPFLGFWTAFEAAVKYGCLCLPGGGLTSGARLKMMIRHQARVFFGTPTYALRLAEAAAEEGIDLRESAVEKIIVAGEPGGSVPSVRERISAAWHGAEVLDHYGLTEVGPTAYQRTGEAGVLRIIESSYLAEIVDPQTGAPADEGEMILTTLGRTDSPLLRYRTGDLVKRDRTLDGFALRGGVLGRVDDMIVVRGVNIYPSAVDAIVRAIAEIREYRVHVRRAGALWDLSVEVEAPTPAAQQLERALTAAFSLRIPVVCAPAGSLPRPEMKARRWVVEGSNQ